MDDLDPDRWRALLAYRDAQDASVPLIVLQDAQAALTQARIDLDRHRSRGPVGHADETMTPQRIEQGFARDIAGLERRVEERDRELKGIDARIQSAAARRNALHDLVEGVRAWAQSHGVALAGDELIRAPLMFSSTSVHVPEAPAGSPTLLASPPPARPGGNGAPPAARAYRGGVIARMMGGMVMSDIENLDAEIARLQAEIVNVERMQAAIAERYAEVETELRAAEALYLAHGHKPNAPHPAQTAHLQRQA